jgi:hypothetical protein
MLLPIGDVLHFEHHAAHIKMVMLSAKGLKWAVVTFCIFDFGLLAFAICTETVGCILSY